MEQQIPVEKYTPEDPQELLNEIENGTVTNTRLEELTKNSDTEIAQKAKNLLIENLKTGSFTHEDAEKLMEHEDLDISQTAKYYMGLA